MARAGVAMAYTWNDRGDLLDDGTQAYTWDAAGRLVGVSVTDGPEVTYLYDGLNDRTAMVVAGVTTTYVVDPFGLVDHVSQVLVEDTNGVTARNFYGLDLLAQAGSTTTTYLGYDALSVRLHQDEDGSLTDAYRYGPFGEAMGASPEGYGFTGERWDHYIKMTYLRARYYQPETGRFISRDSVRGTYQRPQTLNRFVFTSNNPINRRDPTGLWDNPCYDPPAPPWQFELETEKERIQFIRQVVGESHGIFPKGLILAIAAQETGHTHLWSNDGSLYGNPMNRDGIMQVTSASGANPYRGPYQENTTESIRRNIEDGISALRMRYDGIQANPDYGYYDHSRFDEEITDQNRLFVRATLHYNGGDDPIRLYRGYYPEAGRGDRYYLRHIAAKLYAEVSVTFGWQYRDLQLYQDLLRGDQIVQYLYENTPPPPPQP